MIQHDGVLSEDVLERVKKGVLRKLGVACSSVTASQRDAVKEVLQHEPCALLELDLSDCKVDEKPCFEGMTLPQVLLPPTERLACWRLRSLQLSDCGLTGDLATTTELLLECRCPLRLLRECLLEQRASPDSFDSRGMGALHVACAQVRPPLPYPSRRPL